MESNASEWHFRGKIPGREELVEARLAFPGETTFSNIFGIPLRPFRHDEKMTPFTLRFAVQR